MNKLTINLENCYGIKKLQYTFDFSDSNVYAIYAPNGSMKTSLALTFAAVAEGTKPVDRLYRERVTRCEIVDENGKALAKDDIVVLTPYKDPLDEMENTAILLVNSKLREQYERLHSDTENAKKALLKAIRAQSGLKPSDLEKEMSVSFTGAEGDFYLVLGRLKKELQAQTDTPYSDVPYDAVFNEKVLELLKEPDIKSALDAYIARYNQLISDSVYFRKGTFEYYNASSIAKHLGDQGFFKAKHFVTLNGTQRKEITSREDLEQLIAEEKKRITTDPDLRAKFDNIDALLTANQAMKAFRAYILNNEAILSQMAATTKFKQEVWKSYLKSNAVLYEDVVNKRDEAENKSLEILEAAKAERTQWESVIATFNERFFVPCKLSIKNRDAVVVGNAEPLLAFTCEDDGQVASIDRKPLLELLSQGEKKALYILDILFDVQVRRQKAQETFFVIDDIADSFDYRNKYAIIQYLLDMAKEPQFKILVLTHNFDFFRTIHNRNLVRYSKCLMATRTPTGILLERAKGIENVFVNDWKKHFFDDERKRIASIPFIRNLIEYMRGDTDPDFLKLTSLVHWKADTEKILESDLDTIFKKLFSGNGAVGPTPEKVVATSIVDEAEKCLGENAGVNFENKIILSMGIRLRAERFMITKISDDAFVKNISNNQTRVLLDKYEQGFTQDIETIKVLERVALMTPANIHLNAFMYEPIVDMSDEHLKKLYTDVKALK
jgi:hypothetical protein